MTDALILTDTVAVIDAYDFIDAKVVSIKKSPSQLHSHLFTLKVIKSFKDIIPAGKNIELLASLAPRRVIVGDRLIVGIDQKVTNNITQCILPNSLICSLSDIPLPQFSAPLHASTAHQAIYIESIEGASFGIVSEETETVFLEACEPHQSVLYEKKFTDLGIKFVETNDAGAGCKHMIVPTRAFIEYLVEDVAIWKRVARNNGRSLILDHRPY